MSFFACVVLCMFESVLTMCVECISLIRVFTFEIMSCSAYITFAYNMREGKTIYAVCVYRERHRDDVVDGESENVVLLHVYYV